MGKIKLTDLDLIETTSAKVMVAGLIHGINEIPKDVSRTALAYIVQELNSMLKKISQHESKLGEEMIADILLGAQSATNTDKSSCS